jgi:enamine deaminase RidA (YjgF/YER057c/UK114 family)
LLERQRISSGGPWEERVGYPRAVRVGDRVRVSGTTGTQHDGSVPDGAAAQARLALQTIAAAVRDAGASLDDVVAARIYVVEIEEWESIAEVLRESFGVARPAMTMVQIARLLLPAHRIEIEVEAVVGSA